MYGAGVIEHKRFMHPSEWHYYLQNNCVAIDHAKPGAVGRVFVENADEVHGFIHLDQGTIFAKHGEAQAHGYQVMSYEKMLYQYGRTRQCRSSNSTEPHCYHFLKYYLCEKPQVFSASLTKINKALEKLSFSVETKLIYKDNCDSASFTAREHYLDQIKAALIEIAYSKDRDLDLEQALLNSYTHQIYNLEVSNRNYRCKNKALKYKKVREVRDLLKSIFTTNKSVLRPQ